MTLPVSPDHPQVPFTQYSPNQPPIIPTVRRAQQLAYLVSAIASSIANEAGSKAHANAARMFTYNLLSSNYWNNQFFTEAVNLCLEYIELEFRRGKARMPESLIQDATTNVLMLYTGSMVYLFPELQRRISADVLDAASRNVPVFNNFKMEIDSMYGNSPGHFPPGVHGHPNGVVYPNNGYPQGMPMQTVMTQHGPMMVMPNGQMVPVQTQMPMQMPVPMGSNYPVHNGLPQMQQSAFQTPMNTGQRTFASPEQNIHRGVGSFGNTPNSAVPDRFAGKLKTSFAQAQVEAERLKQQMKANLPDMDESDLGLTVSGSNGTQVLTITEGSEMKRSQHQITYFGTAYSLQTAKRAEQHVSSVKTMSEEPVDSPLNMHVYPNWFIESSIDDAIVTAKVKQLTKQNGSSNNSVFRCFSIIPTTLVCDVEIEDYVKRLREAESFEDLAVRFRSIASSFQAKNEHGKYAESVIPFLASIDNRLTDLVNDFIVTGLEGTAWISSFSEDILDLYPHVKKKHGDIGLKAFQQFETEVLTSFLHEELDSDLVEEAKQNNEISENIYSSLFPVNHSVTMTFMTSKELGYEFSPYAIRDLARIDPSTAPTLYKLMQSLETNKKELKMVTLVDYLVTSDGVRYRVFSSYVNPGVYMIKKVRING